jgi:hypothetical protein
MMAIEDLAKDYRTLSSSEYAEKEAGLFSAADGIRNLPHLGLKPRINHRTGDLKAWIKWKSFKAPATADPPCKGSAPQHPPASEEAEEEGGRPPKMAIGNPTALRTVDEDLWAQTATTELPAAAAGPEEPELPAPPHPSHRWTPEEVNAAWSELRFRPITSYRLHFWRELLGLAAKWCIAATKELGWGYHADNPRVVAHEVREFNDAARTDKDDVGVELYDIREFFPNVDRGDLEMVIQQAVLELSHKNPRWIWF